MEYKSYVGSIEFSESDGVFFGRIMGIRALISYEGTTVKELVDDFHGAVDDYLALCEATGQEPEKITESDEKVAFMEDVLEISRRLIVKNRQAYENLAK